MDRLVVREVPKTAIPIKPFELKPTVLRKKVTEVKEGDRIVSRVIDVKSPWPLDSNIARLIGEAKSLPEGLVLRLEDAIFVYLYPNEVAWYSKNVGVSLLSLDNYIYLSK